MPFFSFAGFFLAFTFSFVREGHCLQKSAGAEDDDNVTLEQFTHMVVRMFEQFFRILDRTEAGYLTQVPLYPLPILILSACLASPL